MIGDTFTQGIAATTPVALGITSSRASSNQTEVATKATETEARVSLEADPSRNVDTAAETN